MPVVYLGLGSNVGNRAAYISQAITALATVLTDLKSSSIYETEPRDVVDQPRFLNAVVRGSTNLSPEDLLSHIQKTEHTLGRNRKIERIKGPRTIDIDILLYGALIQTASSPIVPHPRMNERQFVLVPLIELDPDVTDPQTGESYRHILQKLPPQGIYSSTSDRYNGAP